MKETALNDPDRFGGLRVVEGCSLRKARNMKMRKAERRYYVAYGSNLNIRQMMARCPRAIAVGRTEIRDYELLFKGRRGSAYLTIEPKVGGTVPAAVWSTTAEDEARLDRYEGFPTCYYKKELAVEVDGRRLAAYVYIMHEKRPVEIPAWTYVEICLQGCRDFDLDGKHILRALERSREVCGR